MLDARKIYCSIFDIPGLEYDSTDTNYQTVTLPALNLWRQDDKKNPYRERVSYFGNDGLATTEQLSVMHDMSSKNPIV